MDLKNVQHMTTIQNVFDFFGAHYLQSSMSKAPFQNGNIINLYTSYFLFYLVYKNLMLTIAKLYPKISCYLEYFTLPPKIFRLRGFIQKSWIYDEFEQYYNGHELHGFFKTTACFRTIHRLNIWMTHFRIFDIITFNFYFKRMLRTIF